MKMPASPPITTAPITAVPSAPPRFCAVYWRPPTSLLFSTGSDDTMMLPSCEAVAAGATVQREPEDQFYGDRAAVVTDPFGHYWSLHTHIRGVSPEELAAAMGEMS